MTGRSRSSRRGRSAEPMPPAMANALDVLANVPEEMIREQLADIHKAMRKMQGSHSSRTPSGDRSAFAAASRIPYVEQS